MLRRTMAAKAEKVDKFIVFTRTNGCFNKLLRAVYILLI